MPRNEGRVTRAFRHVGVIAASWAILGASGMALADGRGSSSAAFLKLPTGARAIGMGESYTAAGNDVQAIAWNPAGIARMDGREFTFMHAEWYQGIRYESLAYAQPLGGFIFVGGGVDFMFGGKIDKTTFALGSGTYASPENTPYTSTGTFEVSNMVVTAAGAIDASGLRWLPIPNVQLGMNARVLVQKVDKASDTSPVVDMGALWTPSAAPQWTFAFVAQDVGPPVNVTVNGKTERKWPPINFRLGSALKLMDGNFTATGDIEVPTDTPVKLSAGAEYWYRKMICFRTGYKFQKQLDYNQYGSDGLEGFTFGAGFRYQIVQVDYAFATLGFLGATHRVSLTVNF